MIDLLAEPPVRQWSPAAQSMLILPIEGIDFTGAPSPEKLDNHEDVGE